LVRPPLLLSHILTSTNLLKASRIDRRFWLEGVAESPTRHFILHCHRDRFSLVQFNIPPSPVGGIGVPSFLLPRHRWQTLRVEKQFSPPLEPSNNIYSAILTGICHYLQHCVPCKSNRRELRLAIEQQFVNKRLIKSRKSKEHRS
jgi:hypothetical protein